MGETDAMKGAYPAQVFFIVAHEFFERYAYYGVRSVLVIYLRNYLSLDNDASTEIYHLFVAACYLFPLMGGILSDSYWGKVKTILILGSIYQLGLILLTVASLPQLSANGIDPDITNQIVTFIALAVIAVGNGGIKPCVASLGGDQFTDAYDTPKMITGFFSMFYAAINAGSMLSTLVTPILREEVECFQREDCFFAAFAVPTVLLLISMTVFAFGRNRYTVNRPEGNVFVRFCSATWSALCGKMKSQEKREHFMDYALNDGKHSIQVVQDAKKVFPVLMMLLPMPFFWALFDMKGSRWVLTATQTNGWVGGDLFKVKPDQIQLANPIMTLLLLPVFTRIIYPGLTRCGIRVTLLRRMAAGQFVTALSFVVAGLVQHEIDNSLTPIPSYGQQNSLMVINGNPSEPLYVESEYWRDAVIPEHKQFCKKTNFTLQGDVYWRTTTFDWIVNDLPSNEQLLLGDQLLNINGASNEIVIKEQEIHAIVKTKDNGYFEYVSSQMKSETLRAKCVLVNPTAYWIYPRLVTTTDGFDVNVDFSGNDYRHNWTVVSDFSALTNDAEVEQGKYTVVFDLYQSGKVRTVGDEHKDLLELDTFVKTCETNQVVEMLPGSIWTFMLKDDETDGCSIVFDKDSNENALNIMWLIPQYAIITVGELLNSATGNEFAYTQAPKSMKGVVGSFWFLTTFFGNILDVFFVKIKLYPTQAGEYIVLALVMTGAAMVFGMLAQFFYVYAEDRDSDGSTSSDEKKNSGESTTDL